VTVEAEASRLEYPAGDGSVSKKARVLVLAPSPGEAGRRHSLPTLEIPARVEVGEVFLIEIRVPRAGEGEVRTFRIRCGRPGLRLLDPDVIEIVGRKTGVRRAIADSAGPATFEVEDLTD
jgi:hypothetical protein